MRKWDAHEIVREILRRYQAQQDLSHSGMSEDNPALLRAGERYFGSWRAAIECAGLNYEEIRRYKVWTKDRIIERIRELHQKGEDLSWGHISLRLDPALAASAVKRNHFGSWQEALEEAGLDYERIRRYQDWSSEKVLDQVHELYDRGERLNAKRMAQEEIRLITAARRRFPSWDRTLSEAGLDARKIIMRGPYRRKSTLGHRASR
jgi:ASC-1-like (ASCH) protein